MFSDIAKYFHRAAHFKLSTPLSRISSCRAFWPATIPLSAAKHTIWRAVVNGGATLGMR